MSHPTMGAWIEIDEFSELDLVHIRRTPRWVRGLKSVPNSAADAGLVSRTPRWVRGLK